MARPALGLPSGALLKKKKFVVALPLLLCFQVKHWDGGNGLVMHPTGYEYHYLPYFLSDMGTYLNILGH